MVNDSPLVSIVIPTYNRADDLNRTLNSVLNQTYVHWEAIVVDNYSIDHTDQVVHQLNDNRIRLLKIHNNGIVAASRNMGIRNAKGKYIAFLDSDDWWTSDKLANSVTALEKGYDIVYHDLWMVFSVDKLFQAKYKTGKFGKQVFQELMCRGNKIINSSVVIKSEILLGTELLSEEKAILASEDYELWIKIALKTNKFYRIPICSGFFWYGGNNLSKRMDFSQAASIILQRYHKYLKKSEIEMAEGYHKYLAGIYLTSCGNRKSALISFCKSIRMAHFTVKLKAFYRILFLFKQVA